MSVAANLLGMMLVLVVTACNGGHPRGADKPDLLVAETTEVAAARTGGDSSKTEINMGKPEGHTSMVRCEDAIQMIQNRDFRNWRGLPSGCNWPSAHDERSADPREWWVRKLRGHLDSAWTENVDLAGYYQPRFTYHRGDLMLFDGRNPELSCTSAELLEALGEPAAKLDWDAGTLPLPGMEWVWPERGIALYLGGDADHVSHVALFAATTSEEYKKGHLRIDEKKGFPPINRGGKLYPNEPKK